MMNEKLTNSTLRPLEKKDLPIILEWRNHPDIRNYMFNRHIISQEEHSNWFKSMTNDNHQHCLLFEIDNEATGFVSFTILNSGKTANWGFYLSPKSQKGSGKILAYKGLDYGFNRCHLNKVCGKVISHNSKSIRFHKELGFSEENIQKDHYFDGNSYHSIIHFGLLASHWINNHDKKNVDFN